MGEDKQIEKEKEEKMVANKEKENKKKFEERSKEDIPKEETAVVPAVEEVEKNKTSDMPSVVPEKKELIEDREDIDNKSTIAVMGDFLTTRKSDQKEKKPQENLVVSAPPRKKTP